LRKAVTSYDEFLAAIEGVKIIDEASVRALVAAVNQYRREVLYVLEDRDNSGQENLRSTIMEEFFQHLFGDIVRDLLNGTPAGLVLRKESSCYVDLTFAPKSFPETFSRPNPYIHTKDQDFVIGAAMVLQVKPVRSSTEPTWPEPKRAYLRWLCQPRRLRNPGTQRAFARSTGVTIGTIEEWEADVDFQTELDALRVEIAGESQAVIPVIAIEAKTYIERTMLDSCAGTARRLKAAMPYCLYIVAAEYLKLEEAHPELTAIDEIFVLCRASVGERSQYRRARRDPHDIDSTVVYELFEMVHRHLRQVWWSPNDALNRGRIIGRP
jgi:hypothetical protein